MHLQQQALILVKVQQQLILQPGIQQERPRLLGLQVARLLQTLILAKVLQQPIPLLGQQQELLIRLGPLAVLQLRALTPVKAPPKLILHLGPRPGQQPRHGLQAKVQPLVLVQAKVLQLHGQLLGIPLDRLQLLGQHLAQQ